MIYGVALSLFSCGTFLVHKFTV